MKRKKTIEMIARAKHHAKKLLTLATVFHDILHAGINFKESFFTGSSIHIKTKKGVYIVNALRDDNKEYIGIKVTKANVCLVKLMVIED